MSKLLIDTNIFIYALDPESIHYKKCVGYLTSSHQLFTTSKNISEYFAVTSKLNVKTETVLGFYDEIKRNITILFPNDKSLKVFEKLYGKYLPKGNRVFDLEIVSIMIANRLNTIATINQKDFIPVKEVKISQ